MTTRNDTETKEVAPALKPGRRWRALVAVQRGGDRLPFFCVHGAGGNVLNFRGLSRAMRRSQPFFGLQARGVDGTSRPHGSIEEMARAYLSEVLDVQPTGPYLLGGYSGGGIVAFEMAQLLTAAGRRVALLSLIDTRHPHLPVPSVTMFTRVARLRDEGLRYILRGFQRQWHRMGEARDRLLLERRLARGEPIPFALRDMHLVGNFRDAVGRYQPNPWPGRATLFRATDVGYANKEYRSAHGWDRHVLGGVEVVVVPGDHQSLLLGMNADLLGRSLGAAIERAQVGGGEHGH